MIPTSLSLSNKQDKNILPLYQIPSQASSSSGPNHSDDLTAIPEDHQATRRNLVARNISTLLAGYIIVNRGGKIDITAPLSSQRGRTKRTSRPRSPKSEKKLGQIILGNQIISGPKDLIQKLAQEPIFLIPRQLCIELQQIPNQYRSMSIKQFIEFCCLQATTKSVDSILSGDKSLTEYYQIYDTLLRVYYNVPAQNDLDTLQRLIDYFSTKNLELTSILSGIKVFFSIFASSNKKLNDLLITTWETPAYSFTFPSSQKTLQDSRTTREMEEEVVSHVCLLPSMIYNFGMMLKEILRQNSSTYENIKTTFGLIIHGMLKNAENSTHLMNDLEQYPEEQPAILKFLALKGEGKSINLDDPLWSPKVRELIKYIPLRQFRQKGFFTPIDITIRTLFKRLEEIWAVDLEKYLVLFSNDYGQRLFREKRTVAMRQFISHRKGELKKLMKGIETLCTHINTHVVYAWRYTDMFLEFPVFIMQEGNNHQSENYWSSFRAFSNRRASAQKWNELDCAFLKKECPELSPLINTLLQHLRTFDSASLFLSMHARAIKNQKTFFDHLEESMLQLTANHERRLFETQIAEQRRLRIEKELFEEEEKTRQSKQSNNKKPPSSSSSPPPLIAVQTDQPSRELSVSSCDSTDSSLPIEDTTLSNSSHEEQVSMPSPPKILSRDQLFNYFLEGLKAKQMKNPYAMKSWKNVIEHFKDLMGELQDPSGLHPEYLAEHLVRLLVIASLLLEQILSAHLLERRQPTDRYKRWNMLRHDFTHLLKKSGLMRSFENLPQLADHLANLETLSRSPYTTPRQENLGAELLYSIEEIHSTQNPKLMDGLKDRVYDLLEIELIFLNQLLFPKEKISSEILKGVFKQAPAPLPPQEYSAPPLLKEIDRALSRLPLNTDEITIWDPKIASPAHHVADAKRQLKLLRSRLMRSHQSQKIRNLYKILTTSLPQAAESLFLAGATLKGIIDWTKTPRSDLPHNQLDWCIKLGVDYTPEMLEYLISSGRVLKYTRASHMYVNERQESPTNQRLLSQITTINTHTSVDVENPGEEGWQVAGKNGKTLQQILSNAKRNAETGLTVFIKIAETVWPIHPEPSSSTE
ncbi:MAG: hypothetical protein ACHQUC_07635 [Chlamydiales bacterium]